MRPAAHLLSFASPKESRQRKGDPTCRVPFAALRGNLRCSRPGCRCGTRCVLRTTLRQPQRVSLRGACMLRCTRAPRPLRFSARPEGKGNPHGPSLRSALAPSPQPSPASGRGSLRPSAAMARWGSSPLCACRGAQGVGRARAAQHARASCTDSLRLFERSAQREVSSAMPPRDRAPQVARSEAKGHAKWGRLSLPTFFGEAKKVGRPPGRTPGRQRIQPLKKSRHTAAPASTP